MVYAALMRQPDESLDELHRKRVGVLAFTHKYSIAIIRLCQKLEMFIEL